MAGLTPGRRCRARRDLRPRVAFHPIGGIAESSRRTTRAAARDGAKNYSQEAWIIGADRYAVGGRSGFWTQGKGEARAEAADEGGRPAHTGAAGVNDPSGRRLPVQQHSRERTLSRPGAPCVRESARAAPGKSGESVGRHRELPSGRKGVCCPRLRRGARTAHGRFLIRTPLCLSKRHSGQPMQAKPYGQRKGSVDVRRCDLWRAYE